MANTKHKVFIDGPIDPQFISEAIAKHSKKKSIGAHSIFLGQVREDEINGKKVSAIHYTAYEEMAMELFHEIREAAFEMQELTCLHIYHSLGRVNAGEICLFVFTSAQHRKAAIIACEEIVEKIKANIPIWGEEILEDESLVWKKENQELSSRAHG